MAESDYFEEKAEDEFEEENSEDYEEIDDLKANRKTLSGVPERKMRVQEINLMIKKLLEERDELERAIEFADDDLPAED